MTPEDYNDLIKGNIQYHRDDYQENTFIIGLIILELGILE